jgi:hypothetical protein
MAVEFSAGGGDVAALSLLHYYFWHNPKLPPLGMGWTLLHPLLLLRELVIRPCLLQQRPSMQ